MRFRRTCSGAVAVASFVAAGRLTSGSDQPGYERMPHLAAFNRRTAHVLVTVGTLGVVILVIGMIIWAAS